MASVHQKHPLASVAVSVLAGTYEYSDILFVIDNCESGSPGPLHENRVGKLNKAAARKVFIIPDLWDGKGRPL